MARFLQNLWYAAAWEQEVADGALLPRTLLGDRTVIFRKPSDGAYVMLQDRCPHRFAPLSRGSLAGDAVECAYHGLRFDAAGACVHSPFSDRPPVNARVRPYPVVARHGLIWFWPGDPSLADDSAIPDLSCLDGVSIHRGYSLFAGGYQLLTDNLLDLSHAEFIHRESFHPNGAAFRGDYVVKEGEDGAIWSNWRLPEVNAPPFVAALAPVGAAIDQYLHMHWRAPAVMSLELTWTLAGAPREDALVHMVTPHVITPETGASSHYFWISEPDPASIGLAVAVFDTEDRPMIEAIESNMDGADFWDLNPIHLKPDAAAVYARRRILAMLEAEASAISAAA